MSTTNVRPTDAVITDAVEFLKAFRPAGGWQLAGIDQTGDIKAAPARNADEVNAFIQRAEGQGRNVYFSIAEVPPIRKKATKADVLRVSYLWVDMDPPNKKTRGAELEAWRAATYKTITTDRPPGVPLPNWVIDSGRGYWAIWELAEPITKGNGEWWAEHEARGRGIAAAFNARLDGQGKCADACHNIDRIARLPGTINQKTGQRATATRLSYNKYDLADFPEVKETLRLVTAAKLAFADVPRPNVDELDLSVLGNDMATRVRVVIKNGPTPPDDFGGDRSGALWFVLCQLCRAGVGHNVALALIMDKTNTISEHIYYYPNKRKRSDVRRYAEKQVEEAYSEASQEQGDAQIEKRLHELNKRYFVIPGFIVEEGFDSELGQIEYKEHTRSAFQLSYGKEQYYVGKRRLSIADKWLKWEEQRNYLGGMKFCPSGNCDPDTFNTWRGFGVEPKQGDWSLMKAHMLDNLCNGSLGDYNYLTNWLGRSVQRPELQAEVAIVAKGPKGCGKGTLGRAFVKIYGPHGLQLINREHFTGRFSGHMRDICGLFVDEALYAGDKSVAGVLQGLITEPTLLIEDKGKRAYKAKNYLKIIMATNEDWAIPATQDERRYFVLVCENIPDRNYFVRLYNQLEHGGYEAMLYDLLHVDLTSFDIRDVPETQGLREEKLQNLKCWQRWAVEVLERGGRVRLHWRDDATDSDDEPKYSDETWSERLRGDAAYDSYIDWCHTRGIRHPINSIAFGMKVSEVFGEKKDHDGQKDYKGKTSRVWTGLNLEELRAKVNQMWGTDL
jgi:hypothetical protein